MIRPILLLGDPALYEISAPIQREELAGIKTIVSDLHDTLMDYRARHGAGRAIAAPQIGMAKRLVYMHVDRPVVFINPTLAFPDNEQITVMDDCMSFPGLLVQVRRYKQCEIHYLDMDWKHCRMQLTDDLAELLQHECDHLDGILATMRAVDKKSFYYTEKRQERKTNEDPFDTAPV